MCDYLDSEFLLPGWGCCRCRRYNGIRHARCVGCNVPRCAPLQPDKDTGRVFEDRVNPHSEYEHLFEPPAMHPDNLRKLIQHATPGPLRLNRFDSASCITYQIQSEASGGAEREQFAIVADVRDDECPRAKATAELIVVLYNHAADIAALETDLAEARTGYHTLDARWDALHNMSINAFRDALGMPGATIPEMLLIIQRLKERHDRSDSA